MDKRSECCIKGIAIVTQSVTEEPSISRRSQVSEGEKIPQIISEKYLNPQKCTVYFGFWTCECKSCYWQSRVLQVVEYCLWA